MNCLGCLIEKEEPGYCKKCLNDLFDGMNISHVLPFNPPAKDDSGVYTDLTKKLSISGVQIKYSMRLEGEKLVFTEAGGHYILKPIPVGQFKFLGEAPANEHLTMQIARQFFKISIPPNATILFNDGSPAYLVRRFDIRRDGSKIQQEDFAQIAQVTEETHGKNYKYDLSYEEIAGLIRKHISMHQVEMEKFFRLVLFNYAFSNGDAHVRNFSAMRSEAGDYVLTPAYDLLCTKLHSPGENDMALSLCKDRFSDSYMQVGFYTQNDFIEFGKLIGLRDSRALKIIDAFRTESPEVLKFIDKSFLGKDIKDQYKNHYVDRVTRFRSK